MASVGAGSSRTKVGTRRRYAQFCTPFVPMLVLAASVRCGTSTTTSSAGKDAAADDAAAAGDGVAAGDGAHGPAADAGTSAAPPDSGDGGGVHDASAVDSNATDLDAGVLAPDGACLCRPYWCGCGVCDPGQVACTVSAAVCARGCNSSCVELTQVACSCNPTGRCARSHVDAAAIGCLQDQDCPVGDCCARSSPAFDTTGSCVAAPNAACH